MAENSTRIWRLFRSRCHFPQPSCFHSPSSSCLCAKGLPGVGAPFLRRKGAPGAQEPLLVSAKATGVQESCPCAPVPWRHPCALHEGTLGDLRRTRARMREMR